MQEHALPETLRHFGHQDDGVHMKIFAIAVVMGGIAWAADSDASWSAKSAAAYLDAREGWWLSWPTAARDHDTACVSCHTALPYGLARNALGRVLRESAPSEVESKMLANIAKRVRLWSEVQPFYPDATRGVPETAESRGTEAILERADWSAQPLYPVMLVQTAFESMWAIQLTSGDRKGAWMWLNFHNSPWEADDSQFYGTALAALVVGTAPEKYRPAENVKMLRDYLAREYAAQSPVNRIVALWADAKTGRNPERGAAEIADRRNWEAATGRRRVVPGDAGGNVEASRRNAARYAERRIRDGAGHAGIRAIRRGSRATAGQAGTRCVARAQSGPGERPVAGIFLE